MVVDRIRAAIVAEHSVFGFRRRAESRDVRNGSSELKHGSADAAGGHLHEHRFTRAQVGGKEQHVVCGKVRYRKSGRAFVRYFKRNCKGGRRWNARVLRVTAEVGHSYDALSNARSVDSVTNRIDDAGDFVT